MTKLTLRKLEDMLKRGLKLDHPEFHLERLGNKIAGSIISESFVGKRDIQRQTLIWDLLEDRLGTDSWRLVGMLFAFTPDEWDIKFDGPPPKHNGHAKRRNAKSSVA